jgi:hypothetical protein
MIPLAILLGSLLAGPVYLDATLLGKGFTNTIRITWTAPGDDADIGRASEYDIRISESPIDSTNFESAVRIPNVPPPQEAGCEEVFVITGLKSSTEYYIALKTADEVPNWSRISNIVVKTTK